mgnify:CR=1 FL=1
MVFLDGVIGRHLENPQAYGCERWPDREMLNILPENAAIYDIEAGASTYEAAAREVDELADMLAELLLLERSPEAAVQAARQALRLGGEIADRLDWLGRCLNNLGELGE